MKIFHLFLYLVSPSLLFAQNLVPNPSFEQITDCDLYFDQIEKVKFWKGYHFTPDVFNSCSESSFLRTPSNTFDVQAPATGKGYVGILTYHWEFDNELIGTKLLRTVEAGKKYEIKLKVSRAAAHARYATNNLGIQFSNEPEKAYESRKYHWLVTEVIEESDIWYEVKAIISPEQSFAYIVIGNFFPSKETTIQKMEGGNFDAAYYFIDDVSVVQVSDEMPLSEVAKPSPATSQPYKTPQATFKPKKEEPKNEEVKSTPDKPSLAISGTVYDAESKTPLAAEVEYFIPNTKTKELYEVDYRTGQYAFTGIEQKEFVMEISARNYYTITQKMRLNDFSRIRKDFYLQPLRAGQNIPLKEVIFDRGNADFNPDAFPELNRLVQILKDNPKMKIESGGYTNNPDNQDLSKVRAEAVKKYLVEIGGISPDRIKTQSYYQTQARQNEGGAAEENLPLERVAFKILN
jgi:outer membrane protein OmpA-like peptidoglycan-associated protein